MLPNLKDFICLMTYLLPFSYNGFTNSIWTTCWPSVRNRSALRLEGLPSIDCIDFEIKNSQMAVHIAPWWLCCIFTCPVQNCHDHTAGPAPWQQAQWHDFYELQEKQIAKQSNPVMQSTDLAIQTRILNPTHPVVNISQQEPSRKAHHCCSKGLRKKENVPFASKDCCRGQRG